MRTSLFGLPLLSYELMTAEWSSLGDLQDDGAVDRQPMFNDRKGRLDLALPEFTCAVLGCDHARRR